MSYIIEHNFNPNEKRNYHDDVMLNVNGDEYIVTPISYNERYIISDNTINNSIVNLEQDHHAFNNDNIKHYYNVSIDRATLERYILTINGIDYYSQEKLFKKFKFPSLESLIYIIDNSYYNILTKYVETPKVNNNIYHNAITTYISNRFKSI